MKHSCNTNICNPCCTRNNGILDAKGM